MTIRCRSVARLLAQQQLLLLLQGRQVQQAVPQLEELQLEQGRQPAVPM
jgi:hypothetical protein